MRKALFLLLILGITTSIQATDVSGPVSGVWTPAGNPYNVVGELTVPANLTLTLQPGVQVIFLGHYKFLVYGMLEAVGTPEDSILFTASNPTTGWWGLRFYDLNTQQDSSRLVYCRITNGVSSSVNSAGDDKNGGAIFASNSSKLLISHCLIDQNRTGDVVGVDGQNGQPGTTQGGQGGPGQSVQSGYGGAVYLNNSDVLITECRICFNHTGNAVGGAGGNGGEAFAFAPIVTGGNGGAGGSGTSGDGGGLYAVQSDFIIINCSFWDNFTGTGQGSNGGDGGSAYNTSLDYNSCAFGGNGNNGGVGQSGQGGAIFLENASVDVYNHLFYENRTGSAQGGNGGNGGWAWADYSLIREGGNGGNGGGAVSGNGGAVATNMGSPRLVNGTVYYHYFGSTQPGAGGTAGSGYTYGSPGGLGYSVCGTGSISNSGGSCTVTNYILWNNVNQAVTGDVFITYSCIQGGYVGIGNINADPVFVNAPAGGYFLSQLEAGQPVQSPCVDAGDPGQGLFLGTTRTDSVLDAPIMDIGYHYSCYIPQAIVSLTPPVIILNASYGYPGPSSGFTISNPTIGSFNYQIEENIDWLSVSPMSGGPVPPSAHVFITTDIAGLPMGVYQGNITITAPGAWGSPATLPVTLNLGNARLALSPQVLQFQALFGVVNPPDQHFTINNSGLGILNYSIAEDVPWLSVSPTSGGPVPPVASINVSVNATGLSLGTYNGNVVVAAPFTPGAETLHVVLNVVDHLELTGSLSGFLPGNVNYWITGNISVGPTDSLVIESGASFLFQGSYTFDVSGYLNAQGTHNDSIEFKSGNPNLSWKGIKFNSSSDDSSKLSYSLITGVNTGDGTAVRAPIFCNGCSPVISNCTISGNKIFTPIAGPARGGAIRLINSNAKIEYCTVSDNKGNNNVQGTGIFCNSGNPRISFCKFENDSGGQVEHAGVVYIGGTAQLEIAHCHFANNYGSVIRDYSSYPNLGHINIWRTSFVNNSSLHGAAINLETVDFHTSLVA